MNNEENLPIWDNMVGGNHYRKVPGEQIWDRLWRVYGPERARAFFVGNIEKYLERYHTKDGLKDLEKARHYLNKLISLEEIEAKKKQDEVLRELDKTRLFPDSPTEPKPPLRGDTLDPGSVFMWNAVTPNDIHIRFDTKLDTSHCRCLESTVCPLGKTNNAPRCTLGEIRAKVPVINSNNTTCNCSLDDVCPITNDNESERCTKEEVIKYLDSLHKPGPVNPRWCRANDHSELNLTHEWVDGQQKCNLCGAYRNLRSGMITCPGSGKVTDL